MSEIEAGTFWVRSDGSLQIVKNRLRSLTRNRLGVIQTVAMATSKTGLVRAIGRWSLLALTVNSIIGSGVFGLPGTVAGLLGRQSTMAVLIAGAAAGIFMACFAEIASYFSEAGGPYLYARTAFGRLMGIQTGWMLWLAQAAAPAANANLFVIYLAEF